MSPRSHCAITVAICQLDDVGQFSNPFICGIMHALKELFLGDIAMHTFFLFKFHHFVLEQIAFNFVHNANQFICNKCALICTLNDGGHLLPYLSICSTPTGSLTAEPKQSFSLLVSLWCLENPCPIHCPFSGVRFVCCRPRWRAVLHTFNTNDYLIN